MSDHGQSSNQSSQGFKSRMSNLFDMRSEPRGGGLSSLDRLASRYNARHAPYSYSLTSYKGGFSSSDSSKYRDDSNSKSYSNEILIKDRFLSVSNPNTRYSPAWKEVYPNLESGFHLQSNRDCSDFSQNRSVSGLFDISDDQQSGSKSEGYGNIQKPYMKSEDNQEFTNNSRKQSYQDTVDMKVEQGNVQKKWDMRDDKFGSSANYSEASNFDRNMYTTNKEVPYRSNERKQINEPRQSPFKQKFQAEDTGRRRGRGRRRRFGRLRGPPQSMSTEIKEENLEEVDNPEEYNVNEGNTGRNEEVYEKVSNERKQINEPRQLPFKQKFQAQDTGRRRERGRRQRFGRLRGPPQSMSTEIKEENLEDDNPEEYNDNESNIGRNEEVENERYEKVNPFIPDKSLIDKYIYYPPSAEEMAKLFDDLVIYYIFNAKNSPEKNPFVIACESFRRSERYADLQVEDGYLRGKPFIKFCTMRWHGMMMVRGVGENGCLKEPRVRAGIELINKLAKSSFTLKMRAEYYSSKNYPEMLKEKERPGVFKVVSREEAPDDQSVLAYIENFYKEDSDCELVFPKIDNFSEMKWNLRNSGYETRSPVLRDVSVMIVSKRRTPQYWRDTIFASGCLQTDKHILIPPTGMRDNLYPDNFNIATFIPKMNKCPVAEPSIRVYGPHETGEGPDIELAIPPWHRKQKNKNKQRRKGPKQRTQRKFKKVFK